MSRIRAVYQRVLETSSSSLHGARGPARPRNHVREMEVATDTASGSPNTTRPICSSQAVAWERMAPGMLLASHDPGGRDVEPTDTTETTETTLTDDQIETVFPSGLATGLAKLQDPDSEDADGTDSKDAEDAQDADGTDGDATDGDAADGKDGDGTDASDGDATGS